MDEINIPDKNIGENDPSQSKVNDSFKKKKKKSSSKNRMSAPCDKSILKQKQNSNGTVK